MIPRMLLAAILSLWLVPCASAQVRVNSVNVGHFSAAHLGGSNQLLPYIRSIQNPAATRAGGSDEWRGGRKRAGMAGDAWRSNAGSPQWGGYAAATGASGAGHAAATGASGAGH